MKKQVQFPSLAIGCNGKFSLLSLTFFLICASSSVQAQNSAGVTVAGGNGAGSGTNQLNEPFGVFVDATGDVFVADSKNSRIQKFKLGSTKESVAETVVGNDRLSFVRGIFVDAAGGIVATDDTNSRVRKFVLGAKEEFRLIDDVQTARSRGIFIDAAGNSFVIDASNHSIQKFLPGSAVGIIVAGGKGKGSNADQLSSPSSIFIDATGNLFISDTDNHRIQKFTPGSLIGVTVAGGNGKGGGENQLSSPRGVFVDAAGYIFVADQQNHRVQKFSPIAIAITKQPDASEAICSGTDFQTTVTAHSERGLSYEWYKDNLLLPSQTSAIMKLLNTQQRDAGNYKVVIRSDVSTVSSKTFKLVVNPKPVVTIDGSSSIVHVKGGNSTDISIVRNAKNADEGLTYKWMPGNLAGPVAKVYPETTTTYEVTATDPNGCASFPTQVTVKVNGLLGTKNRNAPNGLEEAEVNEFEMTVKAFPNPVRDVTTVEILSNKVVSTKLEVLDMSGRTMRSQTEQLVVGKNEVKIRLSTLPTGIYLIRCQDTLNRQSITRVSKE